MSRALCARKWHFSEGEGPGREGVVEESVGCRGVEGGLGKDFRYRGVFCCKYEYIKEMKGTGTETGREGTCFDMRAMQDIRGGWDISAMCRGEGVELGELKPTIPGSAVILQVLFR